MSAIKEYIDILYDHFYWGRDFWDTGIDTWRARDKKKTCRFPDLGGVRLG